MSDHSTGVVLNGTYRVISVLAEGAMGVVYLASHLRLPDKRFAIKVLKRQLSQPDLHARFRQEAEIAAKLSHPNIVDVVDFNEMEEGYPYIVMEYLEGETLGQRLARRDRLRVDHLSALVGQIGAGLQVAHEVGVVHRDIKPDNLFLVGALGGPINCKILDFGVSKIRDRTGPVTRANALIGTVYFMSPEQASGATSAIDATTDIFALGTLSYRLLTNRLPFFGHSLGQILDAIVNATADLEFLPPSTRPVVGKALAKTKSARYQRVEQFTEELVRALKSPDCSGWLERGYAADDTSVGYPHSLRTTEVDQSASTSVSRDRLTWSPADSQAPTEIHFATTSSLAESSRKRWTMPRIVLLGVMAIASAVALGIGWAWIDRTKATGRERLAENREHTGEHPDGGLNSQSNIRPTSPTKGDASFAARDGSIVDTAADGAASDGTGKDARPSSRRSRGRMTRAARARQRARATKRSKRRKEPTRGDRRKPKRILGDRIPSL
jgi:serine/threonine protein kinase